jgi:hypothetical protein
MKIELMGYQVMEAIALYTKEKMGVSVAVDTECFCTVEVSLHTPKYQKDSEGQFLRDEHGHSIPDRKRKQFKDYKLPFDELDTISFYAKTLNQEDAE